MSSSPEAEPRFAFGENWREFAKDVDEDRIRAAEKSLTSMLGLDNLRRRSFLDVGCGSGLFSFAGLRLGAESVHSFDFDAESVAAAGSLRLQSGATNWKVELGDVTDPAYTESLGVFDVVYAWGVLHHTGALWQALENTIGRVAPGGLLFVAIYNDQGPKSARWRSVKKLYNRLPRRLRAPYTVAVMLPGELRMIASAAAHGRLDQYISEWTERRDRGMSRWHDLLDWVGGYPFEVARPEQVFDFCRERGLELVRLATAGGGLGCNQFVFRRV